MKNHVYLLGECFKKAKALEGKSSQGKLARESFHLTTMLLLILLIKQSATLWVSTEFIRHLLLKQLSLTCFLILKYHERAPFCQYYKKRDDADLVKYPVPTLSVVQGRNKGFVSLFTNVLNLVEFC